MSNLRGHIVWCVDRLLKVVSYAYFRLNKNLNHHNWAIRYVLATCTEFTPTSKQVERGLTDPDPYVRAAWAKRKDLTATPAQVERGLTDHDKYVQAVWIDYVKVAMLSRLIDDVNPHDVENVDRLL